MIAAKILVAVCILRIFTAVMNHAPLATIATALVAYLVRPAMGNNHGGKRPNAGRKRKWFEPMMRVYIPKRLLKEFRAWLEKQIAVE